MAYVDSDHEIINFVVDMLTVVGLVDYEFWTSSWNATASASGCAAP